MQEEVGRNIQRIRQGRGLTGWKMARLVREKGRRREGASDYYSQSWVSGVENGTIAINLGTAIDLAEILGVSLDFLVSGGKEREEMVPFREYQSYLEELEKQRGIT